MIELHFTSMFQYCIYFNPADFPGLYVVRKWEIPPKGKEPIPRDIIFSSASLDECRQHLPPGLFMVPRQQYDDHTIVETWI